MKVIQKLKPEKYPVLVSKTETRWQNFSLSSRSLRLGGKILMLVSKHEIEREKFSISSRSTRLKERKSRSRLEAWDWKKEILDPVSDTRLKDRYSRSRLESWNRALVGHWILILSTLEDVATGQLLVTRLWRVLATRPVLRIFFTTRTLLGKFITRPSSE